MSEQDLFTPNAIDFDPEVNYVEQLVGEGKKFTDPNKLAFGKLQSDRFIERLQQENERMRQEINQTQRMEELVTKLSSIQPQNQSASNNDNQNSENTDTDDRSFKGLSPEDAELLITRKLTESENFKKSLEGIKHIYGQDYQTQLDAEAKKLGLDSKEVNTIAKTNPELFLRLFQGANKPPTDEVFTPPSSINTNSLSSNKAPLTIGGVKTEAYYKQLKQSDPKKYWSKEVQLQEMQDATRLGPAFFNA